jgi:endonuclease YncB( thermonuclease family)
VYTYNGKVTNVVDGDTVDVTLDLGFDVWIKTRFRLNGIDTAEKNFPYGKATKEWLKVQLEGKNVLVKSYKHDKYGRWLCDLFITNEAVFMDVSVSEQMIALGIAKIYKGDSKSNLWSPEELALSTISATLL